MNPIERAHATADKVIAANKGLEQPANGYRQGGTSLVAHLHGMHHGQTMGLQTQGGNFEVSYHARQSHGDNGQPVRGATEGEYTVQHPNGMTTEHAHGPHATTPAAAKKGANPNARGYAAEQAVQAISRSASGGGVFNDRRSR